MLTHLCSNVCCVRGFSVRRERATVHGVASVVALTLNRKAKSGKQIPSFICMLVDLEDLNLRDNRIKVRAPVPPTVNVCACQRVYVSTCLLVNLATCVIVNFRHLPDCATTGSMAGAFSVGLTDRVQTKT